MRSLRFAIIGCGRIAGRHAGHIAERGTLTAVCDIIKEKADGLAHQYKAKAFYSVEELLRHAGDIDVVAVCSPNGLHATHTIQALQAGCHVLCEKPMALHVQDCHAMIEAAAQAQRQLMIVKQNRFNPPVMAVKKALDENRMGNIYSLQLNCFWNRDPDYYANSWKGTLALDGGTLYTQFSHFIDLLYWLAGDVKQVKALAANYAHRQCIEFEDTGVVLLEFKNGAIGSIHYTVNSYRRNMEGSLTIFGEKGTVKIGGQYLNELAYQQIEGYTIDNLPAGNAANKYGNYEGSMSNHDKVYDNFIGVLQNKEQPFNTAADGSKTVEIIEKIYREVIRL
jgi:UDP-N-acetyl-2-amino-2-deoxyglucuronate dehydrogenase